MQFRLIFIFLFVQGFSIHGAWSQVPVECETTSPLNGLESILAVGQNFAPNYCWSKRKNSNSSITLKSDLAICDCLKNSSHPGFKYLSVAKSNVLDQPKMTEEELKTKAKETGTRYGLEQDGFAFQAFTMSKGDEEFTKRVLSNTPELNPKTNFMTRFASSLKIMKKPTVLDAGGCVGTVCRMNIGNFDNLSEKEQEKVEKDAKGMLTRAVNSFKVEQKTAPEIFTDKILYPGKQCISAKDFFLWRQLPQGKKINDLIKSTSLENFSSKDWNYIELEKEYKELMNLPISHRAFRRDRIVEIKEKLRFLNTNQMLKTFLAANSDLSDLDKNDSITPERKENIRSLWLKVGPNLEEKKKEVFKIIKDIGSAQRDVSKFNDPKTFEAYQNELKKFFDGDNLNLVMNENERQGHHRVTSDYEKRIAAPPLTHKMISDNFLKESNVGDPADCKGPKIDEEKCTNIYTKYCQKFVGVESKILIGEEDSDLADDLHDRLKDDFNPDMNANPEFKRWNDQICNTKYSKSSIETSPPLTFFEYLKKKCPNCEKDPEKVSQYRERFLTEYTWAHSLKENVDRDQIHAFRRVASTKTIPKSKEPITRDPSLRAKDNVSFTQTLSSSIKPSSVLSSSQGQKQVASEGSQQSTSQSGGGTIDQGSTTGGRNFSSMYSSPTSIDEKAPKKVEEMSNDDRQKYLSRLEKEYEDKLSNFEKKNGKGGETESGATTKELQALRSEIDSWKSLLAQQQNITAQQMKMMNEAMIARANQATQVASAPVKKKVKNAGQSSIFSAPEKSNTMTRELNDDVQRSSIGKESTSGGKSKSSNGSSKLTSPSSAVSAQSGGASSSESVAREQAKLNGLEKSFVIESKKEDQEVINIPVSVSTEQYQNLKTDPSKLSLDPKQMELLNRRGVITIIVGAEGKPPLELQVEKVENKIVYNVKEKTEIKRAPASRTFTREALELQFQN